MTKMIFTEEELLELRMNKVNHLLKQNLSESARHIWSKHAKALKEMRLEKANKRIEALARLGGAFLSH